MYNISWRILERAFVGSAVNIKNEYLLSGFMGNESECFAFHAIRLAALRFIPHLPR